MCFTERESWSQLHPKRRQSDPKPGQAFGLSQETMNIVIQIRCKERFPVASAKNQARFSPRPHIHQPENLLRAAEASHGLEGLRYHQKARCERRWLSKSTSPQNFRRFRLSSGALPALLVRPFDTTSVHSSFDEPENVLIRLVLRVCVRDFGAN